MWPGVVPTSSHKSHGNRPLGSSRSVCPHIQCKLCHHTLLGMAALRTPLPLPQRVLLESVGRYGAWQRVTGWGAWPAAVTRCPSWRHRDQIRFFRLSQRGSRGLARARAWCQGWRAGTLLCLPQLTGSVPEATATLMRLPRGFPTPPVPNSQAFGVPEPQEESGLGPAANIGCQPRDKHAPDNDDMMMTTLPSEPGAWPPGHHPGDWVCLAHLPLQKMAAYPSPGSTSPRLQVHVVPSPLLPQPGLILVS